MLDSGIEFFRQHIILSNLVHVAGGYGLALVLLRHFPRSPLLTKNFGWLLIGLALVVHVYAYLG
jgi:hypothetical protein